VFYGEIHTLDTCISSVHLFFSFIFLSSSIIISALITIKHHLFYLKIPVSNKSESNLMHYFIHKNYCHLLWADTCQVPNREVTIAALRICRQNELVTSILKTPHSYSLQNIHEHVIIWVWFWFLVGSSKNMDDGEVWLPSTFCM